MLGGTQAYEACVSGDKDEIYDQRRKGDNNQRRPTDTTTQTQVRSGFIRSSSVCLPVVRRVFSTCTSEEHNQIMSNHHPSSTSFIHSSTTYLAGRLVHERKWAWPEFFGQSLAHAFRFSLISIKIKQIVDSLLVNTCTMSGSVWGLALARKMDSTAATSRALAPSRIPSPLGKPPIRHY